MHLSMSPDGVWGSVGHFMVSCVQFTHPILEWDSLLSARAGCVSDDLPKLPGHSPGQPAGGGPARTGGWTRWPPEVPSHLNHSVILWGTEKQYSADRLFECEWMNSIAI